MLSDSDRYQLSKMMEQNNVVDKTDQIRESKHSGKLKENIESLLRIKKENPTLDKNQLEPLVLAECYFLFAEYMELYNLLMKEGMDFNILFQLLDVLKEIEDGKCDQQEGSFKVGTLLKEIYIDSKLAETKKRDALYKSEPILEPKVINWLEYKNNCTYYDK
jgi:hypothetical protein